ncbi:MAG: hypothetical protein WCQ64_16465, partial [Acidobacteriota bacterium]
MIREGAPRRQRVFNRREFANFHRRLGAPVTIIQILAEEILVVGVVPGVALVFRGLDRLGLPIGALDVMGACVLGEMLAFPMYDGTGEVCGIRTRKPDGSKRAVTGCRAGVFLPTFHDGGRNTPARHPVTARLE